MSFRLCWEDGKDAMTTDVIYRVKMITAQKAVHFSGTYEQGLWYPRLSMLYNLAIDHASILLSVSRE